jgi:hypothetical protein
VRLRGELPLLRRAIRALAHDAGLWAGTAWIVDSTPMECARSRPPGRCSPGGLGWLWLLPVALAVLLGAAAARGLHPAGLPARLGPGQADGR